MLSLSLALPLVLLLARRCCPIIIMLPPLLLLANVLIDKLLTISKLITRFPCLFMANAMSDATRTGVANVRHKHSCTYTSVEWNWVLAGKGGEHTRHTYILCQPCPLNAPSSPHRCIDFHGYRHHHLHKRGGRRHQEFSFFCSFCCAASAVNMMQVKCSLYCTVYVKCMCSVCAMYGYCSFVCACMRSLCALQPCMFSACAVYVQCMCSVCAVYVQCMCSV